MTQENNNIQSNINMLNLEWQNYKSIQEARASTISKLENDILSVKNELSKSKANDYSVPSMFDNSSVKNSQLNDYIRGNLTSDYTKHFSSDGGDGGGFTIESEKYSSIISSMTSKSAIRQLASADTISSNMLELVIQKGEFNSGWVIEGEERLVTDNPKLEQKKILVHELYAQPKATQRLLDDSFMDIENWLTEKLVETFVAAENKAFVKGDGNNKPKGFLTYSSDKIEQVKSEVAQKVSLNDLVNLINSLEEPYIANATFIMNRRTLAELQKIKDENGRFIWQPSLSEKFADTILGIPIFCCNEMPTIEKDSLVIALADLKAGYKIVDRQGINIMKDPYTEKPFVKFYATKRVGGDVINCDAIKLLKI